MGSNAFHMDYIWCLIDSIWIPVDCQTDCQMDSDWFIVGSLLDSVGFNIEVHMVFDGIPVVLIPKIEWIERVAPVYYHMDLDVVSKICYNALVCL